MKIVCKWFNSHFVFCVIWIFTAVQASTNKNNGIITMRHSERYEQFEWSFSFWENWCWMECPWRMETSEISLSFNHNKRVGTVGGRQPVVTWNFCVRFNQQNGLCVLSNPSNPWQTESRKGDVWQRPLDTMRHAHRREKPIWIFLNSVAQTMFNWV